MHDVSSQRALKTLQGAADVGDLAFTPRVLRVEGGMRMVGMTA